VIKEIHHFIHELNGKDSSIFQYFVSIWTQLSAKPEGLISSDIFSAGAAAHGM